jgi:hypothetical protein
MALGAYTHFRFLWGAVDYTTDDEAPAYDATNTDDGISNAAFARRCILRWDRSAFSDDIVQTHVDLVNVTAGALDDTWTSGDFTTVEGYLDTFWNAIKAKYSPSLILSEYRWYRLGPGAVPPEPTVRVTPKSIAGTSATDSLPPQISPNVSLQTALRKRWGRIYLPAPVESMNAPTGNITQADVDTFATAANALETSLAGADFEWVVYSPTKQRAYTINRVVMDNVFDVQRSRRFRRATYRKVFGV